MRGLWARGVAARTARGRKPSGGRRRSVAKHRVVLKKAGEPKRPPNLAGGKGTRIGRLAI
jgi:hypothetical protein